MSQQKRTGYIIYLQFSWNNNKIYFFYLPGARDGGGFSELGGTALSIFTTNKDYIFLSFMC